FSYLHLLGCLVCSAITCYRSSFSSLYGATPSLHSFPTRRSSDLFRCWFMSRMRWPVLPIANCRVLPRRCVRRFRTPFPHRIKSRSEEHTSELQSRENLVCRLRLEKNNAQYTAIAPAIRSGAVSAP